MNTNSYIWVVAGMAALGIVAIVVVTSIRPDADNAVLIATIIGLIATTTASILSFQKAQQTHLSVNSRLDSMLENNRLAAQAKGKEEGVIQGVAQANKRTDALTSQKKRP